MIAVDTNLLVYAHREDSDFHDQAFGLLKELAENSDRWCIPWPCLHEFLAISTHSRIFRPPTPLKIALKAMDTWLASPMCEMLGEGPGYFEILKRISKKGKIAGATVHDARVAALCIYHGVRELWTADRDFSRFSELKTKNPL